MMMIKKNKSDPLKLHLTVTDFFLVFSVSFSFSCVYGSDHKEVIYNRTNGIEMMQIIYLAEMYTTIQN